MWIVCSEDERWRYERSFFRKKCKEYLKCTTFTTKLHMRPTRTQISLCGSAICSAPSQSANIRPGSFAVMRRMIKFNAELTCYLVVNDVPGLKCIVLVFLFTVYITKTRLFKYIKNFITKNWKFSDKNFWYFSYFCSKRRLWVLVRTASPRRF